jgi:hypothetical protein
MHEIIPTDKPIYYVARDDDGTILHSGVTYPGQVTTTGLKNMISGDEAEQVAELERFIGKRPDSSYEVDTQERKWIKIISTEKIRTREGN